MDRVDKRQPDGIDWQVEEPQTSNTPDHIRPEWSDPDEDEWAAETMEPRGWASTHYSTGGQWMKKSAKICKWNTPVEEVQDSVDGCFVCYLAEEQGIAFGWCNAPVVVLVSFGMSENAPLVQPEQSAFQAHFGGAGIASGSGSPFRWPPTFDEGQRRLVRQRRATLRRFGRQITQRLHDVMFHLQSLTQWR
jgi:hypothetical protein